MTLGWRHVAVLNERRGEGGLGRTDTGGWGKEKRHTLWFRRERETGHSHFETRGQRREELLSSVMG